MYIAGEVLSKFDDYASSSTLIIDRSTIKRCQVVKKWVSSGVSCDMVIDFFANDLCDRQLLK